MPVLLVPSPASHPKAREKIHPELEILFSVWPVQQKISKCDIKGLNFLCSFWAVRPVSRAMRHPGLDFDVFLCVPDPAKNPGNTTSRGWGLSYFRLSGPAEKPGTDKSRGRIPLGAARSKPRQLLCIPVHIRFEAGCRKPSRSSVVKSMPSKLPTAYQGERISITASVSSSSTSVVRCRTQLRLPPNVWWHCCI